MQFYFNHGLQSQIELGTHSGSVVYSVGVTFGKLVSLNQFSSLTKMRILIHKDVVSITGVLSTCENN